MEDRIREALAKEFSALTATEAKLDNLGGHASLRIYWRIDLPSAEPSRGDTSLMAMVLPENADPRASEEGASSADEEVEEFPFVAMQEYLDRLGLRVPEIDFSDPFDLGVLLLEDLGDTMFEQVFLATPSDRHEALYEEAVDLLIDVQTRVEADDADTNADAIWRHRAFDVELLRWELDHFTEWGLEALAGEEAVDPYRDRLDEAFDAIVAELLELPKTMALRDYQSRNIMRKNDEWVLIDFQDALVGPFCYDLVALLRDSYIELDPEMVDRLVDYYVEQASAAGLGWADDRDAVHRAFQLQTLQRKLKDTGRFVYIDQVKNNPDFLRYFEPSLGYVQAALDRVEGFDVIREVAELALAHQPS